MAKSVSLDDLDVPEWFAAAARELQVVKPRWLKKLPRIPLQRGGELPAEASLWILSAIAATKADSAGHGLLDEVKKHCDSASLDAWTASILAEWVEAGASPKSAWLLTGAGLLGGDASVRGVREAIRKFTTGKLRTLALNGLEALGRIGTQSALQEVSKLSAGVRDRSVSSEAQKLIESEAETRGMTREMVEDMHVSDCGLNRDGECLFNYGPRTFRAALGKALELKLYESDGKQRTSLPPVAKTDDRALAEASREAWAEMKTEVKRVAKAQIKRFERVMITGHAWTLADFRTHLLQHPILVRIAQSLVWQTTGSPGKCLRVTEDLTLADSADTGVLPGENDLLCIAHPLRISADELKVWTGILSDYQIVQPFQQLAREALRCDPSAAHQTSLAAPVHAPIKPGVLYGMLENDGWRPELNSEWLFTFSWKSFPAENVTAAIHYTGLMSTALAASEDQTVTHCTFHPGTMKGGPFDTSAKPLPLGEVPAVAFSETARRLRRLAGADK